MDSKKAIRLIRNLPTMCEFTDAYGEQIDSDAYYEAVGMAISALQEHELSETQNSLDTISRAAALKICRKYWHPTFNPIMEEIEQLPSAQPEQQWIPVSERLPEEHIGFYLVTVQKRRITALNVVGCDNTIHDIDIARWDYDRRAPQRGYHWCKADKVIAWMPLQEPYRKEGD